MYVILRNKGFAKIFLKRQKSFPVFRMSGVHCKLGGGGARINDFIMKGFILANLVNIFKNLRYAF